MHTLTCKPPTLTCVHICDDLHTHTTHLSQTKQNSKTDLCSNNNPPPNQTTAIHPLNQRNWNGGRKDSTIFFINITYINIKQCLRKPFLRHGPRHLPGKSPRSLSATGPQGAALLCTGSEARLCFSLSVLVAASNVFSN